ncbi:hypothetical protein GGE68_001203 [Rhizobium leguminosarum]|nr:hypothetical protein [Rhizobium leguminosarum]
MNLPQQQTHLCCGRISIGADVFLASRFETLADLERCVARQSLNVPKRQPAADQQVEEDGSADDQDELCPKAYACRSFQ